MYRRNHFKQLLVTILCFTMFISMLYQPVYAIESNVKTNTTNGVNTTADNYEKSVNVYDENPYVYAVEDIDYELVDKREDNIKYFRMNDGTIQAYIYEYDVHELDDNNVYQEVDNSLEDNNNNELENTKNNKWKVKFSKKAQKTLLHIHDGNMNIKWGIVGYNSNAEVKYLENDEEYNILSNKAISQTIVYENILDNIDVQYQVGYRRVKENVVLKNTEAQHIIYYELDTNGYDMELVDNRVVVSKNNEIAYYIEAPFMLDSNGVFHNGITLSIEGKYIKMELDSEWLLQEERAYPVYVDPTIDKELDKSKIKTTSVYSNSPNSTQMYSYGAIYVGKESSTYGKLRGALRFELPEFEDKSLMVINATVTLNQLNYYGNGVTVYPVMGKLLTNTNMANLTWNKFAGNCQFHNDYIAVGNTHIGKNFSLDITEYVREWYQKGNNYGIGFASENESSGYRYATFVTSNNTGLDSRFPKVSISYLSTDGLESYFTYQSMNTMSMGDFYVGDFNGNLVYTYNDFSMNGNYLPVGISHVYNHHQRDEVTPVSSNMKYGKGMRLNVSMRVSHDEANDRYELIDEDGTKHYFFKESTNIYTKEFDTDVKLVVNTNNYTIKNRTQELEFSKSTGLLLKVKDLVNNKEQTYTYNANQLTSITDGADRTTSLEYNTSNQLTKITYADNKVITYQYTNEYLTKITQFDGNIINFTYTTTGELASVVNENEGKVVVTYHNNSLKQVSEIARYGVKQSSGTYPKGDYFTMCYDLGETKVTDHTGYSMTYLFDRFGHTISSVDSEGNGMYGVYGNNGDNNHHNLSFESSLQTSTINLAVNHRAKNNSNWTSDKTVVTVPTNDTNPFYSGRAFKLTGESYLCQTINYPIAKDESYTVSAYVKSIQDEGPIVYGDIYGINIGFTHGSGYSGSEFVIPTNEWQRISYTFTAEQAYASGNWKINFDVYNTNSTILVKNIQLEKGTVANRYNFIENGHFKESAGSTSISYWTYTSDMDSSTDMLKNESGESLDGTSYFIAYGLVDKAKYLTQTVDVSGKKGDVFVLSGWNKNESVIQNGLNKDFGEGNKRERSVKIHVYYKGADGKEVGRQDVYFSSNTHNWQYASGSVVAPADYASIEVRLYYSYQKWFGMFDNIQMYVESFGNTYEYNADGYETVSQDKYGNIVLTEYASYTITNDGQTTSVDLPSKRQYKRKKDPDYLMETVYTYTNGKLTKEIIYEGSSETGNKVVETEYTYDANGNLESTTVNGDKKYASGQIEYSTNYISSYTNDKGAVTNYEYNEINGQLNKVIQRGTNNETDTDDIITEYEYDEVTARLQTVTNGDSKVEYTYTTLGLIDTIKHNTSTTTSDVVYKFVYDEFGNVSSIKVGNGTQYNNLAAYVYKDNNGQLEQVTYGNGENIEYVYDELGRVIKIKEDDVIKYSWEYGTDGKVGRFIDYTLTEDGESVVTKYAYDSNRNVVLEERANGVLFNEYDTNKNLLRETGYRRGNIYTTTNNNMYVETSFDYNSLDELTNVYWNTDNMDGSVEYGRDDLRRINSATYLSGETQVLQTTYEYLDVEDDTTKKTSAIEKVIQQYDSTPHEFTYSYNEFGNIVSIKNDHGSSVTNTYKYDKLNQLVRENNKELNKTFVYSYDNGGNITEVKTYDYTQVSDLTGLEPSKTDSYTYNNSTWKDLLTGYKVIENGEVTVNGTIEYDNIGNPTKYYDGKQFTWNFRRLEKIVDGDTIIDYTYNQDGIRTSKKVGNEYTYYFISGNRILHETTNNEIIYYEYDGTGKVSGFVFYGNRYTYVKNGLNDIIGILDSSANLVATYKYDAWGNVSVNNLTNDNLGDLNPFRYRGYYYDSETGYYYLNSRYYDPEVKRFINADSYASTGQGILGHNMFAYCQNNPVMYYDSTGTRFVQAKIIGGGGDDTSGNSQSNAGRSVSNQEKSFVSKIQEDLNNFNLNNTDEKTVIEANYFSFYKGKIVVWNSIFDRSGSFGMIFMSNANREDDDVKDIVRHEYGHTIQLKELGVMKYTFCIFIPSANEWGSELYYYKPWELSASIYGGAHSLYKKSKYNQMVKAHQYMDESRKFGIYSWRLIE